MALTVSSGYLPFAVSSESMTVSAPWTTAVATSETSARVGSGLSTIDESIWVATMQSLAWARQREMSLRWTMGTTSTPASTAMSPRATMIPSAALTISSRFFSDSMAFLVSILAITLAVEPRDKSICLSLTMSLADWTKERET